MEECACFYLSWVDIDLIRLNFGSIKNIVEYSHDYIYARLGTLYLQLGLIFLDIIIQQLKITHDNINGIPKLM